MPAAQQSRRGPTNDLHSAAHEGLAGRTRALLSRGSININQGTPEGFTPLMVAAMSGHSHIIRMLLDHGANISVVDEVGFTALLCAAQNGALAATVMLIEAGSDIEARSYDKGCTPLHVAAAGGHFAVMKVLIEAGANPNNIGFEGSTPLFGAAFNGHVEVVKELLRVKADPRLARTQRFGSVSPLDVAAEHGHSSVVRELTQLGVSEGGGGPSGGVQALQFAGKNQHLDAMIVLADAGVVDTGAALIFAADYGKEASVKFLLQRNGGKTPGEISYVNSRDPFGRTALVAAITCRCYAGARIARSLVDAGADTSSALRITDSPGGGAIFDDTPLALTARNLREIGLSRIRGPATEERFQQLEGIRRLLLQVEAVHAASWLWPNDPPFVVREASEGKDEVKSNTTPTPTPLTAMLPILRRRVARRGIFLATSFR